MYKRLTIDLFLPNQDKGSTETGGVSEGREHKGCSGDRSLAEVGGSGIWHCGEASCMLGI